MPVSHFKKDERLKETELESDWAISFHIKLCFYTLEILNESTQCTVTAQKERRYTMGPAASCKGALAAFHCCAVFFDHVDLNTGICENRD